MNPTALIITSYPALCNSKAVKSQLLSQSAQQAAECPQPRSVHGGRAAPQTRMARQHRGKKAQPAGTRRMSGGEPGMEKSLSLPRGEQRSSSRVYSCAGESSTS